MTGFIKKLCNLRGAELFLWEEPESRIQELCERGDLKNLRYMKELCFLGGSFLVEEIFSFEEAGFFRILAG